jgi:hypothetical protein
MLDKNRETLLRNLDIVRQFNSRKESPMEQVPTPNTVPSYDRGILLRDDELTHSRNRVPKLFKLFMRSYPGGPEIQPTIVMALNITQALARYTKEYDLGHVYKIEEMEDVQVMLYPDPALIAWASNGRPKSLHTLTDEPTDGV